MARTIRVTGLTDGAVDLDKTDIHFTLSGGLGKPLKCIARLGVVDQIISGLGRMAVELRAHLKAQSTAAETVVSSLVHREMSGVVLMRLTSDRGVPYTFALNDDALNGISEQLQAEIEKGPRPVGHA